MGVLDVVDVHDVVLLLIGDQTLPVEAQTTPTSPHYFTVS